MLYAATKESFQKRLQTSQSLGNKMQLFSLAVETARHNAADLPKECATVASKLDKIKAELEAKRAEHHRAKREIATLTATLLASVKEGDTENGKIVRFAQATYGSRSPKMVEFRSRTEGKITRRFPRTGKGAATNDVDEAEGTLAAKPVDSKASTSTPAPLAAPARTSPTNGVARHDQWAGEQ